MGPWVPQSAHLKDMIKPGEAPRPRLLFGPSFHCLRTLGRVLCSQVGAVYSRGLSETRNPDAVAVTDAGWEKTPPGHKKWMVWRLQEHNSQYRKEIDASCPSHKFLPPPLSLPSNVKTFNIYLLCVRVCTHTHVCECHGAHVNVMHFFLSQITLIIRQQRPASLSC